MKRQHLGFKDVEWDTLRDARVVSSVSYNRGLTDCIERVIG